MKITATDMVKGRLKIFDSDTKIVDALLASSASFLVLFHIRNK
jgi:NTE family protein